MKALKIFFIFFSGIIVFTFLVLVLMYKDIVIDKYTAEVTLSDNGDMTVVETWDMNYKSQKNVRFRDIAYSKYNQLNPLYQSPGNITEFDENSVKVKVFKDNEDVTDQTRIGYSFRNDVDERGEPIECYPETFNCESIFVDMTRVGGMKGKVSFEYTYKINGAVTKYSDISELNWNLFEYAEGPVKKALVNFTLPNNNKEDNLYLFGHGFGVGSNPIKTSNYVVMEASDIKTSERLEFRLLMDNTLFPHIYNRNIVINNKINKQVILDFEAEQAALVKKRLLIARVVLGLSIASVVGMGLIILYVYKKYDKEYQALFTGDYYRELPSDLTPAEMSYLYYFGKTNDEDVTATLLDLTRREYVSMDVIENSITSNSADFTLRLNSNKNLDSLYPHEKHLLRWFFLEIGDGSTVTTKQIETFTKKGYTQAQAFQNRAKEFVRHVNTITHNRDFFEKGLSKAKGRALGFVLIPIVMLIVNVYTQLNYNIDNRIGMIASVLIAIVYVIYVSSIKKRSIAGNEEYVKWKAFKNFLEDFSSFEDYPMPGVAVWEHYLVYATSLKIADKVMEQLRVKLPINEYNVHDSTYLGVGYRYPGFYYGYAFGSFNRSFTTAKHNAFQTISAHNAASISSGGRGGGFGGGRSFGGGGGGGRSR